MLPRLGCVFHAGETLTNFCTQGNCLLPLCPTCIKIHTAEHVSMRTTPQYEQINHLLNQVSGDIQKCSRVLEGDLDRLNNISKERLRMKEQLLERIMILKGEFFEMLNRYFNELTAHIQQKYRVDSQPQTLEKFKKALTRQINTFGSLEDSIYTSRAMRTVIKFKAEDILSKTNLAHAVNQEFIEKCQQKEVEFKVSGDYRQLFKTFLEETLVAESVTHASKVELQPLDITGTIELHQQTPDSSSPKHNRSRRADSEERKSKPGIRLIGLENQTDLLLQGKKNILAHRRSTKITGGIPLGMQRENLADFRSIKAFNFMGESIDRR